MRFKYYMFDGDKNAFSSRYVVHIFSKQVAEKVHSIGIVAVAAVVIVVGVVIVSLLSPYRHRLQNETLIKIILSMPCKIFEKQPPRSHSAFEMF